MRRLVGWVEITLIGPNSATVVASPERVFSDGIRTSTATIHLVSLYPDGRVFRPTSTGTITLVGIQDTDTDSVPDPEDNCPAEFNPLQEDSDLDGTGDVCDPDDDNDEVNDVADNCPLGANPLQEDFDVDGLGNACDDVFGGDDIIRNLEAIILEMRDIIVAANPPGGNGMIAKLTGKGGILSKAAGAINAIVAGEIDIDTYLRKLDDALTMLDALVHQLEGKIGNGQISELDEGNELRILSAEVREFIEVLQTAVGG